MRLIKKVIVKQNGSMRTFSGKKATWNKIAPDAKFYHEKKTKRRKK